MTVTSIIIRRTGSRCHPSMPPCKNWSVLSRNISSVDGAALIQQCSSTGNTRPTSPTSSTIILSTTYTDIRATKSKDHNVFNPIALNNERYYSTTNVISDATSPSPKSSSSIRRRKRKSNNTNKNTNSSSSSSSSSSSKLNETILKPPPLSEKDYDPVSVQEEVLKASQWNQGQTGPNARWDPQYCAQVVDRYEAHLHYISDRKNQIESQDEHDPNSKLFELTPEEQSLLSSNVTAKALQTVTKMKVFTPILAQKVRQIERLIGSIGHTSLTKTLSLSLLHANGKAGNVGRSLSLLNLRKARKYPPTPIEFQYAIQSINSAGLYLRMNRNFFLKDGDQPDIDNPTRWLDAILMNMSSRTPKVQLTTEVANQMLNCYASTGRSGKAVHFFYDVRRDPVLEDGRYYGSFEKLKELNSQETNDDASSTSSNSTTTTTATTATATNKYKIIAKNIRKHMPKFQDRKTKVRMKMRQHLPPHFKFPTDMKLNARTMKSPVEPPSLTAAFAFAESLTYGACGHEPITLDLHSWNTLIKACCYRGSIWKALQILNETMPKNYIKPDLYSYNTVLSGIARLGDKEYQKEILTTMTNSGIAADKYTVQAIVDGHLNAGDISGAITIVQDSFNQHQTLPPYTSHLKIIEFALGNDLLFEAKRHVYFIQQLWKWTASKWHSEELRENIEATKKNPKLSKKSLIRLFAYFGEELSDQDFF